MVREHCRQRIIRYKGVIMSVVGVKTEFDRIGGTVSVIRNRPPRGFQATRSAGQYHLLAINFALRAERDS
jgi:hypothetical protein